jgi:hypothetical protein
VVGEPVTCPTCGEAWVAGRNACWNCGRVSGTPSMLGGRQSRWPKRFERRLTIVEMVVAAIALVIFVVWAVRQFL